VGAPAAVMGDQITGVCAIHQIPNPAAFGAPTPGPPMPFSAPLLQGLAPTVTISGKPAAVVGASGFNTPPHVGLHVSDPFMLPTAQVGHVLSGSLTVMAGGQPLATAQSSVTCCATPGTLAATAATVLVG
jgi:uncharacterized Zn-binding protein involved in type VI secretion